VVDVVIDSNSVAPFWGGGTFTANQPMDMYCGLVQRFRRRLNWPRSAWPIARTRTSEFYRSELCLRHYVCELV